MSCTHFRRMTLSWSHPKRTLRQQAAWCMPVECCIGIIGGP
jgi:hypothetical protein